MSQKQTPKEKADNIEHRIAKLECAEQDRRDADSEVAAHAYKLRQFIEAFSAAQ